MKETKSTANESLRILKDSEDDKIAISSSSDDKKEAKMKSCEDVEQQILITTETVSTLVEGDESVHQTNKSQKRWVIIMNK